MREKHIMDMLWFKIFPGLNFDFSLFPIMVMNLTQRRIKIKFGSKKFKPKTNLNHSIHNDAL